MDRLIRAYAAALTLAVAAIYAQSIRLYRECFPDGMPRVTEDVLNNTQVLGGRPCRSR